jgi:hypothetical protein
MNPSDEFLRHANECERMAKFARDQGDKDFWHRMAQRWMRCAALFEKESSRAHDHPKRHRRPQPQWAHH